KIESSGGPALTLCDAPEGRGGTWNRDGVIVFARNAGALHRVSDSGGVTTTVTKLDETRAENTHHSPCFLPDGQHFLYVGRTRTGETATVYAASLESAESKLLFRVNSNVAYAQGYLLFLVERTLMAQRFDTKR